MKITTLAVAAGISAPLILGGSASGGFTGISTTSKPNEFGIFVVNVYAEFDQPGEDHMIAVAGSSLTPMLIEVIGGTFYQHMFGTARPYAPLGFLVDAFPSLAYDTFVTIGVKCVGDPPCQPNDNLVITAGFPGFGPSVLMTSVAGWAVLSSEPQADPFNPDFFAGDGRVLIGQFSTADGVAIQGTMLLQYISNGVVGTSVVSFQHVLAPPCPWDMDGTTYVGIEDFLTLLANWGTDPGGPPDFDGDGTVDINDFLELLAHWGPCP